MIIAHIVVELKNGQQVLDNFEFPGGYIGWVMQEARRRAKALKGTLIEFPCQGSGRMVLVDLREEDK